LQLFLQEILTIPALTIHLANMAPEIVVHVHKSCPMTTISSFLSDNKNVDVIFEKCGGGYGLCLMANMIHLMSTELTNLQNDLSSFRVSFGKESDVL
jgi:hypothetical protein